MSAAIVAVGRLQSEATAGRDAEIELIGLRLDLAHIQDVPWGASPDEGDDPEAVRLELEDMEAKIKGSLARLGRNGGASDERATTVPFERSMVALRQVFELVSHGRSGATDKASSEAAHQAAAADQVLQTAAGRYRARSTAALTKARLGSAMVILILFGAFAWFYARVGKARRSAERLTAENRELLAVSQKQAFTDALLAATTEGIGIAYRMGGDEFCVIASLADGAAATVAGLAAAALSEAGEGFDNRSTLQRARRAQGDPDQAHTRARDPAEPRRHRREHAAPGTG